MRKLTPILLLVFSIALISCNKIAEDVKSKAVQGLTSYVEKLEREIAEEKESPEFKQAQRELDLASAIQGFNVDKVRQYMKEGYDPNKSRDEQGWRNGTPLGIIAWTFYNTGVRIELGWEIPDPIPDITMLQLLLDAGADINQRPYVWERVYTWDNSSLKSGMNNVNAEPEKTLEARKAERAVSWIGDANRVLEAFLDAGADPDMRGDPYPFSLDALRRRITDEEAAEYFAQGTRPINEAIKKGIRWESQVDLLLQYTTLDEDSLKAAEESGDPEIVEKITRLWAEQQAKQENGK